MGYLKPMGYMSHRALDEFTKVRRIEATEAIEAREVTEEEAVQPMVGEENIFPGRKNKNRLEEMREQGFVSALL